jgi:hypothetical protein
LWCTCYKHKSPCEKYRKSIPYSNRLKPVFDALQYRKDRGNFVDYCGNFIWFSGIFG